MRAAGNERAPARRDSPPRAAAPSRQAAGRTLGVTFAVAILAVARGQAPAAGGQDTALRPAPAPLFGIAGHAWWSDEHFDTFMRMYRELGVTGVRIPLDWKRFEPHEGQYDFSLFDRVFPR